MTKKSENQSQDCYFWDKYGQINGQINKNLSCCHSNVNSLQIIIFKIDDFPNWSIQLLCGCNFFCISETNFDLSGLQGNISFQLNGFNLIRAHSSNKKQGVSIY